MGIISKLTGSSSMELLLREIVDVESNKPSAYLTQVNIIDRKMGILTQDVFMPVAEKTAKAKQILLWSVKKSFEMMEKLEDREIKLDYFSFYCPNTFIIDINAVNEFISLVNSNKRSVSQFAFIVSPQLLITKDEAVYDNITYLRDTGAKIIVQNFGCEGFPLSKVLKSPIDKIILDNFIIECFCGDEEEILYAQSVVEMAKKLGFSVIADNINSQITADKLAGFCDYMSGNLFGKYKKDRYVRKK